MFDDGLAAEPDVAALIRASVREIADCAAGRWSVAALLTCAAVGGHVDHYLTARAVAEIGADLRIPVVRWEDLPYACETEPTAARPTTFLSALDPIDWNAKEAAVRCYTSQLAMLWPNREDGWSALLEHGMSRGNGAPVEVWSRG